ncbi:succinate receptor 1-like [Silurus meridionalis]|uniref:G-protein coupled receptors family 1 profile domain-containing protein n=1 Tax=Silurus meridionalis TaxID=175797 RepID=A0A8T0BFW2_SILME|nr:succinate receptor 1-like [Silurus meridionalis]KAF7704983.1 hypothetical protein HF521_020269 [Silurus meridionalis]
MASNCTDINSLLYNNYLSTMYAVESVIGSLCNLFVILVYIFCLPSWKSTNVYMFNLAISDLICMATLAALSYNYKNNLKLPPNPCVVVRYILHVNLYASIVFMLWVGVDRLFLMWYPQRTHFLLTLKGSLLVSFLNWIWVTIELAPYIYFIIDDLVHNKMCKDFGSLNQTIPVLLYSLLLSAFAYVLPLLALYLLSSRMVSLLKMRQEVLGTSFERPMNIVKAAAVMLLVLYLPFHIMRNMRIISQLPQLEMSLCTKTYIETAYIIVRPIGFFHSVINPVFYVLMTDRFKEILQDKWKKIRRFT